MLKYIVNSVERFMAFCNFPTRHTLLVRTLHEMSSPSLDRTLCTTDWLQRISHRVAEEFNDYSVYFELAQMVSPHKTYTEWVAVTHPDVYDTMTPHDLVEGQIQWITHLVKQCWQEKL